MAEAWIAGLATVAVGAYEANQKKNAAENAANKQRQASALSRAQNQYQFEQTQKRLQPFVESGTNAQNTLAGLLGLGGNAPDFSAFLNSPQYQFALQQGQQDLDRNAASRGTLFSGNHTQASTQFGQGLASQQFQNYFNNLSGLASRGENAAAGVGNAGRAMTESNNRLRMGTAKTQGQLGLYKAGVNNSLLNSALNEANGINWSGLFGGQTASDQDTNTAFNGATGQGTYTGPGAITAPDNISILGKAFGN